MTTVHAQTGIKLATKPAKTSLLGGHFIYKVNNTPDAPTPSSANVVENVNDNPTQWGHNVHIGSNGIKLRYGETTLSKWDTSSLIFYRPTTTNGVTTVTKGIEVTNLGIDIFGGQSDQNPVASFGEMAVIGAIANGKTRTVIYDEGFRFIRRDSNGADSILVNFKVNNDAYGTNPVFTMGSRKVPTNTDNYDNTKTYKVGDICKYNQTNYVCQEEITVAEDFDSSKWKIIEGENSFAFGYNIIAAGQDSMATGNNVKAIKTAAHAEGSNTIANGEYSHAEGRNSIASGYYSHAEGYYTVASHTCSHSEGANTAAKALYSHAEGDKTIARGISAHAEGYYTTASGDFSHTEGYYTAASGDYSHAGGSHTTASKPGAYAEGYYTQATGDHSHAEGYYTVASGNYSHAEGSNTTTSGYYSHAEGYNTQATGSYSHAEGYYTQANGNYSHAMGNNTIAAGDYQTVVGKYNDTSDTSSYFVIGNGTSDSNRSNLFAVDSYGDLRVTIGSGTNFNIGNKNDIRNYLSLGASNLEFWTSDSTTYPASSFGASISRIGRQNANHILLNSAGMKVYGGSETNANKMLDISSSGMNVYKNGTLVAQFGDTINLSSSYGDLQINSTGLNINTAGTAVKAITFNQKPLLSMKGVTYTLANDIPINGMWKIRKNLPDSIINYYTVLGVVGYDFNNVDLNNQQGISMMNVYECCVTTGSGGNWLNFSARNTTGHKITKAKMNVIIYLLVTPKISNYVSESLIDTGGTSDSDE